LIDYGKYISYFIDRLIDVVQLAMDSKMEGNLFMHIYEPGKISRKMGNNTREQLLHNALALANKTPGPLAPVHNRFSVQWNMEWNFG